MSSQLHFNASAQLYENEYGDLAIRFANNSVFEGVGTNSSESFAVEAMDAITQDIHPANWRLIPYRKLFHDDQKWHLIISMGFLDGDETKPALLLEVKPEMLGVQAKQYLKPDMPETLQ